ncbi:MAG TPA: transcription antitermination factor NusB [Thermoanaerobaculia bacterium]|nr:transcription antitermination factor NusB [Thermoanaerobaculia bacterium]
MTLRERAFVILQRVEEEGAFAAPLLGRGDDADLFVRTLVLGVLRWRGQLDFLIEQLSKRSLAKLQPAVVQILRLGLFQLMRSDVVGYAAVSESVNLSARHAPHATKLVNAVLRSATRTNLQTLIPQRDDDQSLAIRYSHPLWLVSRWRKKFGRSRTEAMLAADQELSYPDLLVNTQRVNASELTRRANEKGLRASPSRFSEAMIRIEASTTALAGEMEEGLLFPMDEGSAVIVSLLGGSPRRVLDAAAAPGGKSLAMSLAGHTVTSLDLSLGRLGTLRRSHRRFFDSQPRVIAGDARLLPFRGRFDVALLDAPCSASGTFRKNPEARWRVTRESLEAHAALQREMLRSVLTVAPECIYSTCSLEEEENDAVVAAIVAESDDLECFDLASRAGSEVARWIENGVLRLTPEAGTDGFTAHGIRHKQ